MELYRYQTESLNEIEWFQGRALVALPPGTGKTFVSLSYLRNHPEAFPAVVVCPASVKFYWQREAKRLAGIRAEVLEGRNPRAIRPGKRKLVILNWDILSYWLKDLRKLGLRAVIADECQYAANRSKRTKALRALCRGVPYFLPLSGTPMVNRPIELFNILNILIPREFMSRWTFGQRYCNPQLTPWGWKFQGLSHGDELHRRLESTCMVRRQKIDVLPDLPEKVQTIVPVPLSDRAEYDRAEADFLGWLEEISPERARRAARAETMSRIGYLLRLSARLKMPSVLEWIDDRLSESNEKLVTFAIHKETIASMVSGCQYPSVVIDGSVTGRERLNVVDRFRTDNSVRVLFGNVKAAGTGVEGLQVATTVAFVELPWTPGAVQQAIDRCHRIGTKGTVWIYFLVAHGTIEDRLCGVLQRKQRDLDEVLDGKGDGNGFDVFDELMGELIK